MLKKTSILNIGFNTVTYEEIISFLSTKSNRQGYVCFPDLYNIIRANEDEKLRNIYFRSTLTLPDGKPTEYLLKKSGFKSAVTISGYWLCCKLLNSDLSHFFYGTGEVNLKRMEINIKKAFPNAKVLGYKNPPLINQDKIKNNCAIERDIENIYMLSPDIIWIGISSPKQDFLMSYFSKPLPGTIMMGVGAVFDYFAGSAYMGPEWIKKFGLRWLYQLIKDPKRYYKRIGYILFGFPRLIIKNIL